MHIDFDLNAYPIPDPNLYILIQPLLCESLEKSKCETIYLAICAH